MKKYFNRKFIDKFNDSDKKTLNKFFCELNDKIFLPSNQRILFNEDFEKAISYYLNHGYTLSDTLKTLSVDNIGDCYNNTNDEWYPLDNAAKIYPLSMKESWMSVFRLSYYLNEEVVPEIFQIALTFTMKRFPTFKTSIRRGFFWNYIDGIKKRFHVYRDNRLPCSYINVSNFGKQSFKAVYYKNRISVEYFHILTDGYGGVVFISTLVSTYLNLLGKKVSTNGIILDINKLPTSEEVKDEFSHKTSTKKVKSLVDSKALTLDGKLSNIRPCRLIHFDMNIDEVKKVCNEKDCTFTELFLSFIFLTCSYCTSKEGYIKVQVPVNMRRYYKSKTLRNFSLYVVISIKKSDITSFDTVLLEIKKQMKEKINKDSLDETMTYTNKLVKSLRYIPYFIKRPIAGVVYGFLGDKVLTTVLSNLGNISIPEDMKEYIQKMDFSLGTGITNKALFSLLTCNDVVTLTISKFTLNSSIENSIYNLIKSSNIDVKVYGSETYGSKK